MPNKYPNEPLTYRVRPQPESPNSTRARGRARNFAQARARDERNEKAKESFQLSKMKTLTKQHFRAARRRGTPIGWSEARGRAVDQLGGSIEVERQI